MVRRAVGHAAFNRNDIQVDIPVIVAGKGDPGPIRACLLYTSDAADE